MNDATHHFVVHATTTGIRLADDWEALLDARVNPQKRTSHERIRDLKDQYRGLVDDGRLHLLFHEDRTTGMIESTPRITDVPLTEREIFVADPDRVFVEVSLDMAALYLLAEGSRDTQLLADLNAGDLYTVLQNELGGQLSRTDVKSAIWGWVWKTRPVRGEQHIAAALGARYPRARQYLRTRSQIHTMLMHKCSRVVQELTGYLKASFVIPVAIVHDAVWISVPNVGDATDTASLYASLFTQFAREVSYPGSGTVTVCTTLNPLDSALAEPVRARS